jgi:hypothetical protein
MGRKLRWYKTALIIIVYTIFIYLLKLNIWIATILIATPFVIMLTLIILGINAGITLIKKEKNKNLNKKNKK